MCFGVKQLWKEEEHEFVHYWMMAIEVKEEDIYIQLVWDSCIPPFYGRVENQGNNFVSGELKGYMKRFVSKWKADRRRRSFVTDDYTSKWKKKRKIDDRSVRSILMFWGLISLWEGLESSSQERRRSLSCSIEVWWVGCQHEAGYHSLLEFE